MPRIGATCAPIMAALEAASAEASEGPGAASQMTRSTPRNGLLRSASVATLNASLSLKVDMAPRVLSECLKIPDLTGQQDTKLSRTPWRMTHFAIGHMTQW